MKHLVLAAALAAGGGRLVGGGLLGRCLRRGGCRGRGLLLRFLPLGEEHLALPHQADDGGDARHRAVGPLPERGAGEGLPVHVIDADVHQSERLCTPWTNTHRSAAEAPWAPAGTSVTLPIACALVLSSVNALPSVR